MTLLFGRFHRRGFGSRPTGRSSSHVLALEPRVLLHGHGVVDEVPVPVATGQTGSGAIDVSADQTTHPLTDIPALHSDPAAPVKIYLDFGGAPAQPWGTFWVPATPAYDVDGDPSTFSDQELADINQIWARVAEKYSPFNVDVTTENPGSFAPRQALQIIIGGDGAWDTPGLGGISYIGGFVDGNTTGWVFPDNLTGGDPHNVAEAAAHEAGHLFGLQHQSVFSNGNLISEYNDGDSQSAPIMGRDYAAVRGMWWNGPDVLGGATQDDLATIASARNGFGYRPQDHGQTLAAADALRVSGSVVSASGVIETTSDTDLFSFSTGAGTVNFTADVAKYGPMLNLKLLLIDAGGIIVTSADTASLGETLSANVPAGRYYIEVASHGFYGDVGQYTLSGSIVPVPQTAPPAPVAGGLPTASDPTPPANPPPAPTLSNAKAAVIDIGLTDKLITRRKLRLNWKAAMGKVKNYLIQRSTDGRTWSTIATLGRHARRYTDAKTTPGQACEYRVAVRDPAGVLEYSNALNVTMPALPAKHRGG